MIIPSFASKNSVQVGQNFRITQLLSKLDRSSEKFFFLPSWREVAREIDLRIIRHAVWNIAAKTGKSYNICVDGRCIFAAGKEKTW
jgi:hypothetical protein